MNPRRPPPLQPLERPWSVQIIDNPVKVGLEVPPPRQVCVEGGYMNPPPLKCRVQAAGCRVFPVGISVGELDARRGGVRVCCHTIPYTTHVDTQAACTSQFQEGAVVQRALGSATYSYGTYEESKPFHIINGLHHGVLPAAR